MNSATPVLIPHETVNDESVRLLAWMVTSGKRVEKEDLLGEVETSKAVLEIHAPEAGFVWYTHQVNDEVPVGAPLCFITPTESGSPFEAVAATPVESPKIEAPELLSPQVEEEPDLPAARFTPLAARMARELNISLDAFPRGSMVRSRDVRAKANPQPASVFVPAQAPVLEKRPQPETYAAGVAVRWDLLSKRKIAEGRLLGNTSSVPSLVSVNCPTAGLRSKLNASRSSGPSASALIVFETARLLRKYPAFNAVHSEGKAGFYQEVNIGYAVDGGEGLVVPVIRSADEKSLWDIHHEIKRYVDAYVQNRLQATDLSGATFTISDLSGEGVSLFIPLISRGQAAILGVGAEVAGSFSLTLAFDHQLAEGLTAARFLQDLSGRVSAYEQSLDSVKAGSAAAAVPEKFCTFCSRPAVELKALNAYLLQSVMPEGLICSLCLAEY